jgi:hypothetical protein
VLRSVIEDFLNEPAATVSDAHTIERVLTHLTDANIEFVEAVKDGEREEALHDD